MLAEPIRPPLINSTTSQHKQYFASRSRSPLDPYRDKAEEIVRDGRAQIVALTLGDRGAVLVTAERFLRATGLPVQVSSSIGAGDSFVAAMVWALNRDASLDEAFHYGVAAASAALLSAGTALCKQADVERLYREVSSR